MPDRVYIETTFVSYLTARPSRDLIVAAHQQLTHDWWHRRRKHFELCTSELVVAEASAGDPEAARDRLRVIDEMTLLKITDGASELAAKLVVADALPINSEADAFHVSLAACNGVSFLLTWNCRHLANAVMRPTIEAVCRDHGVLAPIICTADELLEEKP